mmetsp:Transcript_10482/g.18989  ORF Transcript_10482/g.18989 Transcript_10482/m.18989 type:complete len:204 (-) Transcript_10482:1291-1902(-)
MTLLQTSLFLAGHSHIFRKFNIHVQWCGERVATLQNTFVLDQAGKRTEFAFFPASEKSARFAGLQIWFLSNVMLDFVTAWIEATRTLKGCALSTALALTVSNYAKLHMLESAVPEAIRELLAQNSSSDTKVAGGGDFVPRDEGRAVLGKPTQVSSIQSIMGTTDKRDSVHPVADDWPGLSSLCSLYSVGTSSLAGLGSRQNSL